MEDGQISVLSISPAPSTLKHDEEELEEEEDREVARLHVKHREHCPRWVSIHMYSNLLDISTLLKLFHFIKS